MAEIITKAGNRSALTGFNTLSGDPAGFPTADGFNPVLKHAFVACSALVKSSLVHKKESKSRQQRNGPNRHRSERSKGTLLLMNGHRNMNPAERQSNKSNQTATTTESLG